MLNTFILQDGLAKDIVSVVFYIVDLALYMYAGYRATKIFGQDILTAGMAGALAALSVGIFYGIILIPIFVFILNSGMVTLPETLLDRFGGELGAGAVVISLALLCEAVVIVTSIVVNFITGAVGGFIGQRFK